MSDDAHASGGPPAYTQRGARTPTPAERTRTLVAAATDGTMSTVALDPAGYPFGSIVTFALDDVGAPLILMSTMAEHARNLDADPRASLLVSASGEGAGRLAAARATLVGTVALLADGDQAAATERYLEVHPGAFWARFGDFAMRRLSVEAIRYVRGFGEMSWVEPHAYTGAVADPLAAAEAGIVAHMNDDHADALAMMVGAYLDVPGTVRDVTMLACDRYGIEVRIGLEPTGDAAPGVAFGRIGFDRVLDGPDQARAAMVELTKAARGA